MRPSEGGTDSPRRSLMLPSPWILAGIFLLGVLSWSDHGGDLEVAKDDM